MKKWQGVVLHHTAGKDGVAMDAASVKADHLAKGWQDIGYHIIVEQVGGFWWAILGRSMNVAGAHEPTANATHLGLAIVGNFSLDAPPTEAVEKAAATIKWLADAAIIPPPTRDNIIPHRQLRATECPGTRFDMAVLYQLLGV